MGDILKFAPNTGTSPRFSGKGSVIQNPDILPIFLGSAWPLGAAVTSNDIMKALYRLAGGPYLQGLQQYGYSGTATVRNEMIDKQPYTVTAGTPGNQINVITSALRSYLESLVNDDKIDNVDDNHELIVLIFLDPSTQQTGKFSGANTKEEIFEFLDDNIRFQWAWVLTDSNNLDSITRTMSHELVESISDPFHNGWEQTSPRQGQTRGRSVTCATRPGSAMASQSHPIGRSSTTRVSCPPPARGGSPQTTLWIIPSGTMARASAFMWISPRYAAVAVITVMLNGHSSIGSRSIRYSRATSSHLWNTRSTGSRYRFWEAL
jgi:hypothetical protein